MGYWERKDMSGVHVAVILETFLSPGDLFSHYRPRDIL